MRNLDVALVRFIAVVHYSSARWSWPSGVGAASLVPASYTLSPCPLAVLVGLSVTGRAVSGIPTILGVFADSW